MFVTLVPYFVTITRALRNKHMKNQMIFIDDDNDDDDDNNDAVDGDENDPDAIIYVKSEVQNTQYTREKRHVLLSHLQIMQADDLK